jgi:acetate kinase
MSPSILVINSGSSSVKFASFSIASDHLPARVPHGEIEGIGNTPRLRAWADEGAAEEDRLLDLPHDLALGHTEALRALFDWLGLQPSQGQPLGAAHRVVHGGENFVEPVRITPAVLEQLERLVPLALLHQPHNLAAIRAIAAIQPDLPQIACFDTAFHAPQAWVMQAFALPRHITEMGVKRYGFYGISSEYIASVLPAHLGVAAEGRVTRRPPGRRRQPVRDARPQARLHDHDLHHPRRADDGYAVLQHRPRRSALPDERTEDGCCGRADHALRAVRPARRLGIDSDMRALEASTRPESTAAIELYVNLLARELGSLAAMLGGLDALFFTAGIGEHSAAIRQRVCASAAWLGITPDHPANLANGPCISAPGSRASAWVIPTNEELMLATHAQELLAPGSK